MSANKSLTIEAISALLCFFFFDVGLRSSLRWVVSIKFNLIWLHRNCRWLSALEWTVDLAKPNSLARSLNMTANRFSPTAHAFSCRNFSALARSFNISDSINYWIVRTTTKVSKKKKYASDIGNSEKNTHPNPSLHSFFATFRGKKRFEDFYLGEKIFAFFFVLFVLVRRKSF